MKTHMNNTKAIEIYTNYDGKVSYTNHQNLINTQKIKPRVQVHRKQQVKIVNNNKVEINTKPLQHVNNLFKNLAEKKYVSTIDNKVPQCYEKGKKILKDKIKKNKQQNYMKSQHQRQLRSQQSRIQNCKNLGQRKKDNTDPIVNPTYLMRDDGDIKSATIQGYVKTVLKKNRPASSRPISTNPRKQIQSNLYKQSHQEQLHMQTYTNLTSNIPNLSSTSINKKVHPRSASQARPTFNNSSSTADLPDCTFKAILHHIIDNKMYKDVDMKVLYVRLCHKYGDERVDEIWQNLMQQLES